MEKIYVENFRSIKKCEIIKNTNQLAFVGENSTGKSTICAAVLAFWGELPSSENDCYYSEKSYKIGIRLKYSEFITNAIVEWLDGKQNKYTQNHKSDAKKRFKKQYSLKENDLNIICEYKLDEKERAYYFTDVAFKKRGKHIELEFIKMIKPIIAYLPDERQFYHEHSAKNETITNNLLSMILENLSSEKSNEKEESGEIDKLSVREIQDKLNDKIKRSAETLQSEMNQTFTSNNGNDDLKVHWDFQANILQSLSIKTLFHFEKHQKNIDFFSVGSGTRSIYILSLLQKYVELNENSEFTQKRPVIFILEEPELYLYPKLQRKMSEIINELGKKHQILVTTHSSTIINGCIQDAVYKVVSKTEKNLQISSQYQKVTEVSEIMEMLGYDASNLLNKDYVIFVEGKDDCEQYSSVIEKIIGEEQLAKTLFIEMNGINSLKTSLNLQFLNATSMKEKFLVIIDADGIDNHERVKGVMKQLGHKNTSLKGRLINKIFATEYSILEAYGYQYTHTEEFITKYEQFLEKNRDKIKECFNSSNKNISMEDKIMLEEKIFSNDCKKESLEYFRKYGLNKKLANQYKLFCNVKSLESMDETELKIEAPQLVAKITSFYNKT